MRRGVALIDVLVAALILAVGMTVTMSLASQALVSQRSSEHRITASWLADGLLGMVLAQGPRRFSMREQAEGQFEPPFEAYGFQVEIRAQDDWSPYVVRATVTWNDRNGPNETWVETLVAPRQGDEDDWSNWRPDEPVDREGRYWPDEEATEEGSG